jgi:fructose-1,6-bisphosphatase I
MSSMNLKTLQNHLEETCGIELTKLLLALAEGCKVISHLVNNAGLSDILGLHNSTNVHGEEVQKLDAFTNKILTDYLTASETCAGYVSEENENMVTLNPFGRYVASVDPLDGSSNIDVAAPIGTIFSINERLTASGDVHPADFLQPGTRAKAAGYVIYGSSTMLVLTTGKGVNGFTLSTLKNEFYLSHPDITFPPSAKIYSINQGNIEKFDDGVKGFLGWCTATQKDEGRPFSLRYIGSMIGDIHRNMLKGGIFMYPANKGETKGKLRLLYECIPMAFITEQAGGAAYDGTQRILEIEPHDFHERCAIFAGSKNLVDKAMEFMKSKARI